MRRAALALPLLAFALASCAAADPFFARNKLRVYPTEQPQVMTVLAQPGSAGPQFFCAAGEYARGPLGARATDRLVLVEPAFRNPAFRNQRTVRIALVPDGTPLPRRTGILVSANQVGENLSVAHAQFLCNSEPRPGRFFD